MNPPFFSVLVPMYNAAAFIKGALDSVRAQSCRDWELVLVDDGSTDETREIAAAYRASHPDAPIGLHAQANKGIGGARNACIAQARGAYLAFLDADDRWFESKLEFARRRLQEEPALDVLYHDELQISRSGKARRVSYRPVRSPAYEDLLFNGNKLSTSATVVRASLARQVGGFSENLAFNGAEDYDFWLRLAQAGARFAHLGEVLGEYRRTDFSITSDIERHAGNSWNVFLSHIERMEREGLHDREFLRSIRLKRQAIHVYGKGRELQYLNKGLQARNCYREAIRLRPSWWKPYAACLQSFLVGF